MIAQIRAELLKLRTTRTCRGAAGDQRVPLRHDRPTILFNPARSRVLAAKAVAGALAGLAFGILGEAIGWAAGYATLDGRGITVVLSGGAIIALFAWGLVVDDLLFGLAPSVGRFTPTRASDALMGLRVDHLLSPGAGAITLIAWVGALRVVGIALSARQDIN